MSPRPFSGDCARRPAPTVRPTVARKHSAAITRLINAPSIRRPVLNYCEINRYILAISRFSRVPISTNGRSLTQRNISARWVIFGYSSIARQQSCIAANLRPRSTRACTAAEGHGQTAPLRTRRLTSTLAMRTSRRHIAIAEMHCASANEIDRSA